MSDSLTEQEYKQYCECWLSYLENIGRDIEFSNYVRNQLTWVKSVRSWPLVWPEVHYLFSPNCNCSHIDGTRSFIAIIKASEDHIRKL